MTKRAMNTPPVGAQASISLTDSELTSVRQWTREADRPGFFWE